MSKGMNQPARTVGTVTTRLLPERVCGKCARRQYCLFGTFLECCEHSLRLASGGYDGCRTCPYRRKHRTKKDCTAFKCFVFTPKVQ